MANFTFGKPQGGDNFTHTATISVADEEVVEEVLNNWPDHKATVECEALFHLRSLDEEDLAELLSEDDSDEIWAKRKALVAYLQSNHETFKDLAESLAAQQYEDTRERHED